jgi:1-acyl-sn-glycerol-3-phosphate acyltransferase
MKFERIRPFYDSEIQAALQSIANEPMLQGIMKFTFPDHSPEQQLELLADIRSTDDFQRRIIYHALLKVLAMSSEGLSTSGFEDLDPQTPYLFISNHRDIILDTSLLNVALLEHQLIGTASAIGDNLVKKPFLNILSKINRNFLVLRNLPPRELLEASVVLSEYINEMLSRENRSVWIAQREGRTKDGNDATHPGVLKMLSLAAENEDVISYFKRCRIVPVAISYEYDPTDALKLPELIANLNNQPYVKGENEDFDTLYRGITGQKKHIHIHAGTVLDAELDEIQNIPNSNKQIKALTQLIDNAILSHYKLWESNYIAYDLLYHTDEYVTFYTDKSKADFVARMNRKIDNKDTIHRHQFLAMYANPVINKRELFS